MVKIIHVEVGSDPQEPFTWVTDEQPGSLYAFHKVVEERQRYLLRVSNLLSELGTIKENKSDTVPDIIVLFFRQESKPIRVESHGRWTTYKQGLLTIMTEEIA